MDKNFTVPHYLADLMNPKPKYVEEFKGLYLSHFNVELSDEEARQNLGHLLALVGYKDGLADTKEVAPTLTGIEPLQSVDSDVSARLESMRYVVSAE